MSGPVVEGRGVGRRFAGVTALRDVDLSVAAGEAVAVFGPNGAGKTTLLRLLATVLRPSAGTLRLFERPLEDGGAQARRRIGLLSHRSFLYPDLTPVENLEFYARMFRLPQAAARVRDLLEQVGLAGWAHRPLRTLSRGMEQRCALARVLLHEPDLLLLDEPFSGLDLDAGTTLSGLLQQAHARGCAWLMTTHEIGRAFELCTRALILVRGRLAWDGAINAAQRDQFEERYRTLTHGSDLALSHHAGADP